MTRGATPAILRYLRSVTAKQKLKALPDGDLLKHFTAHHDETAFAVMVRRHGAMVLQVCRSLLQNQADAEDAFQATFLVLARQAHSIRKKGSLGSWLYGVAYRTAMKAKVARDTRRRHEARAGAEARPDAVDELSWREAQGILHQELARLPEKYRLPLVLCYLEGKRQDEAEGLLGWPHGKLRSMLERAREHLRQRLVRRGLGANAVLFAVVGFASTSAGAVPAELLAGAVRAAASLASGSAAAASVSADVLGLADGVIRSMTLSKMKLIASGFLAVAVLGWGLGRQLERNVSAQEPSVAMAQPPTVVLHAIDGEREERKAKLKNVRARASGSWDHHTPDRAFDGDRNTMWNASTYAPQWLEADLGASKELGAIRLLVAQLPDGWTTHEVWVSDEPIGDARAKARRAHRFVRYTKNYDTLEFEFPPGLTARHVQVHTTQSPSWVAWLEVNLRIGRSRRAVVEGGEEFLSVLKREGRIVDPGLDKAICEKEQPLFYAQLLRRVPGDGPYFTDRSSPVVFPPHSSNPWNPRKQKEGAK
jgi:RNA polymerase sigma factor (sigma-70 family)